MSLETLTFSNKRLQEFFKINPVVGGLTEWGAPLGQLGRLIPAVIIKNLAKPCLWVRDSQDFEVYPSFWRDLGINLKEVFFLYDEDPLKNLRIPLKSSEFEVIVLDLNRFITPANMNFLAHYCRRQKVTCFLLRKYFLSPKNGNPFCRHRFNCSYSLQRDQIQITAIKGQHKPLWLSMKEVVYG